MGASSSKNKKKITPHDKAILDLKVQRDKLTQYQKKIQVVLNRELEIAKIHLKNGDKKKALLALKKKKYQEQLIEKTDTQLLNLEELTHSIEYALVEKDIIDGLKKGNEVLKELNKEMSIEKVEDLMNETADAIAYQNEISELLSGKLTEEDEDEIAKEIEIMEQEEIQKAKQQLPGVPKVELPEVPKTELPEVPEVETPEVSETKILELEIELPDVPKTKLPEPKIEIPEVQKIEVPEEPKIEVPVKTETELPEVPKIEFPEVPKTKLPEVPKTDLPEVPKIDLPDEPKFEFPEVPKIELPSIDDIIESSEKKNKEKAKPALVEA